MNYDRCLNLAQLFTLQDELNSIVREGWVTSITNDQLITAMLDELTEMIGHGVSWKWWKYTDPDKLDMFAVKVEAIDVAHFYLSLMYKSALKYVARGGDASEFERMLVGTSGRSNAPQLIHDYNLLSHSVYVSMAQALLANLSITDMHGVLNRLAGLVNLSREEFSAIFTAKHELNIFRQSEGYQTGGYVKVEDGVEDNDRLEALVEAFLDDSSMTLAGLRQNVREAYFATVG